MTKQNEESVKSLKAALFPVICSGMLGLVLFYISDVRTDVKWLMQNVPVMKMQIDFMQDRQLKERFESIPPVRNFKHEEAITLDSLTKK